MIQADLILCRREDLNLQGLLHRFLKPARLPISPLRLKQCILYHPDLAFTYDYYLGVSEPV